MRAWYSGYYCSLPMSRAGFDSQCTQYIFLFLNKKILYKNLIKYNIIMLCRKCVYTIPNENVDKCTIWGFQPFIYSSYYEMKEGFTKFIEGKTVNDIFMSNVYNEEGYTYPQWYIYYLCKNYHRYSNLKRPIKWLFSILAEYPSFSTLLKLGSKKDPYHHTLHHFTKYVERLTDHHNFIINILIYLGLSLSDEDGQGCTGYDYLSQKVLSKTDLEKSNIITREYKRDEKILFSMINESLHFIKKCEKCNDPISPYEDLSKYAEQYPHFIETYKDLILSIILKRTECCDIYKAYQCKESCHRHLYIIDQYKRLI